MTREEAADLLNVTPGAAAAEIQRQYAEYHNDCQIRLTNAPTPSLRRLYQRNLGELEEAYRLLTSAASAIGREDLPAAEPTFSDRFPVPVAHTPPADAKAEDTVGVSAPVQPTWHTRRLAVGGTLAAALVVTVASLSSRGAGDTNPSADTAAAGSDSALRIDSVASAGITRSGSSPPSSRAPEPAAAAAKKPEPLAAAKSHEESPRSTVTTRRPQSLAVQAESFTMPPEGRAVTPLVSNLASPVSPSPISSARESSSVVAAPDSTAAEPRDPAAEQQQLRVLVLGYITLLQTRDASRVAAVYKAENEADRRNERRLLELMRAGHAKVAVAEQRVGLASITDERATSEFRVRLTWRTPFGARRSEWVTFRAEMEKAGERWRVVRCRIVGAPSLT